MCFSGTSRGELRQQQVRVGAALCRRRRQDNDILRLIVASDVGTHTQAMKLWFVYHSKMFLFVFLFCMYIYIYIVFFFPRQCNSNYVRQELFYTFAGDCLSVIWPSHAQSILILCYFLYVCRSSVSTYKPSLSCRICPRQSQVFICGRPLAGDFALRSHQSLISIRGNVFSLKDAAGQGKAFFRSHVIRTSHINM